MAGNTKGNLAYTLELSQEDPFEVKSRIDGLIIIVPEEILKKLSKTDKQPEKTTQKKGIEYLIIAEEDFGLNIQIPLILSQANNAKYETIGIRLGDYIPSYIREDKEACAAQISELGKEIKAFFEDFKPEYLKKIIIYHPDETSKEITSDN